MGRLDRGWIAALQVDLPHPALLSEIFKMLVTVPVARPWCEFVQVSWPGHVAEPEAQSRSQGLRRPVHECNRIMQPSVLRNWHPVGQPTAGGWVQSW